ncbi:unnamed protein product [Arctia plantaginis]|uniref:Ommochrome-binding protein-like n=1 Tax=Arctia plantaginis TaxID=874455 RepID=A0A8S1A3D6_ARCPL|nr:unnamed protein product [Arctia plantaginis]
MEISFMRSKIAFIDLNLTKTNACRYLPVNSQRTMKYFILSILITFAEAGIINVQPKCVTIRNIVHEEEVLKEKVHYPYQLALDYDTNTLFFSYTARTTETFKMAYLNLKSNDYGLVSGIQGGFASAVDIQSHIVYMGGEDGVYQFEYNTKSAARLNIKSDVNIWQMFYKDGLYFTTYPEEKAYLYKNQEIMQVSDLKDKVMVLGVKKDGSYVYSNSSGLFIYNKASGKALNIGDYVVNGITSDIDGNIYFSTPSGIYYIDDERNKIEELMKQEEIYGVAIDGNGSIIYAKEDSIIRLKPAKGNCVNNRVENDVL